MGSTWPVLKTPPTVSTTVAPLMVMVRLPSALGLPKPPVVDAWALAPLLTSKVPPVTVTLPMKELAPLRVSVPEPLLMTLPRPVIAPLMLMLVEVLIHKVPLSKMLLLKFPLLTKVPAPLISKVPELIVNALLNGLIPVRLIVPYPLWVRAPPPLSVPVTVTVCPELTDQVWLEPSVNALLMVRFWVARPMLMPALPSVSTAPVVALIVTALVSPLVMTRPAKLGPVPMNRRRSPRCCRWSRRWRRTARCRCRCRGGRKGTSPTS